MWRVRQSKAGFGPLRPDMLNLQPDWDVQAPFRLPRAGSQDDEAYQDLERRRSSEELDGGPRLFSGQDYDRNYDRDRDRERRPDYQQAQRNCSREANREAWNRNYYSAQYDNGPRLDYDRDGWQLRGRMRLHDRRGYSYVNTVCDLRRNGEVTDFDFLR